MFDPGQNDKMIEVLSGSERRRRTPQEKIAIVQQTMEPGMTGISCWICPYKSRHQITLKFMTRADDDTHVMSDIPAHCVDACHYSVQVD